LGDRLRAASQAGTQILIIGIVHKLSTLVQQVRTAAIDTTSQRVVFEKFFTFRGDNDEAMAAGGALAYRRRSATGCLKADHSNRRRAARGASHQARCRQANEKRKNHRMAGRAVLPLAEVQLVGQSLQLQVSARRFC